MAINARRVDNKGIFLFIAFVVSRQLVVCTNEYNVYKNITAHYDKSVRPTHNSSIATVVSIELSTFYLLSMDQIQETITFTTELLMIWNDEILKWNRSAFGDTESVLIPSDLLWRPDIIFESSLSANNLIPENERYLHVQSDGTVRSDSPYVVTCICPLSVETFPFDEQTCDIYLGSWMYPSTQIDLVDAHTVRNKTNDDNDGFDGNYVTGNGEWMILSFNSTKYRYSWEEDGIVKPYINVKYTLALKRHQIYYVCVLLIPTFVTATICLFGLFVPASNTGERIEKLNMGMATLLSMAIILGIVASEMPKSETLPLLGFYVLAELFLCAVGVGISMLIMLAHQRATTRVLLPPKWLTMIVFFNPKEYLIPEKKKEEWESTKLAKLSGKQMENQVISDSIMNSIYGMRLTEALEKVGHYIDEKKREYQIVLQWTIIFDRIDTFFLILFNVINVIMSAIMLLS